MYFKAKSSTDQAFGSRGIQTTGTQEGKIYKYPCFYIKVYDDYKESCHIVQYYRYFEDLPYQVDKVPFGRLLTYASKFPKCIN